MATFTQDQLLSSARLRYDGNVRRSDATRGQILLRSPGGESRLVLTPGQADVLTDGFAKFQTAPEVLVRLLAENRCPPLREFYELVVRAHAMNILVTDVELKDYSLATRWPVRLPVKAGLVIGVALTVAGAGGLVALARTWQPPVGWGEFAIGWLATCALWSLGEALAACAIAGSSPPGEGAEVRIAEFHWKTLFPHFRTDTAEAAMGGRACEQAVAALRAAPMLAGAALLAWKFSGALVPALAGVLAILAPWGRSAAMQWLGARHGAPRFSLASDFQFEPIRADLWTRWLAAGRELRSRFGLLWVGWTAAWLAFLAVGIVRCVPEAASTALAWFGMTGRGHAMIAVGLYAAAAAAAIVPLSLGWAAWQHWRRQRAWGKAIRGADTRPDERQALAGDAAAVLKQLPLFETLNEADLAALAAAMTPVEIAKGACLINEDEPGDAFYVLLEGEMEILKRQPDSKRSKTIGWMGAGDCFGEIALLENTPRTATIRAAQNSRLLRLDAAEFQRLVLARVGAAQLREQLQHTRYLGRLAFAAGWPVGELMKFARRCGTVKFPANVAVLERGKSNIWFFLIYDGAFEARDGSKVIRRMGPGDYFGEISLLENYEATADVVTTEESRCLTLARKDFLELFASDFRVSLRMEALAGRRLGDRMFVSR